MKLLIPKYKTRISLLLLTAYLFSFVVGIIHHHNYEFCFKDTLESERNPISNHFQNLNGTVYDCIIQQNLISLQTAVINLFNDYQFVIYENLVFPNSKSPFHVNSVYLTNNLLRAPPSLS